MSAQPARKISEYERPPISLKERGKLHRLGWKDPDIVEMTVKEARANITAKTAKPGSKAAMKAIEKETGVPNPAISQFSNEAIEERNANADKPVVQIVRDEFTNQCLQAGTEEFQMDKYQGRVIKGADPLNAVLIEMEHRYPDRRFRWMHEKEPLVAGPSWQNVYDSKGEQVRNGELFLQFMPTAIYEEGHRKKVQERSQAMTGRVQQNKTDVMQESGMEISSGVTEGILHTGKSEANYATA